MSLAATCPPGETSSPVGSQSTEAIAKLFFSQACTCRFTSAMISEVLSRLVESDCEAGLTVTFFGGRAATARSNASNDKSRRHSTKSLVIGLLLHLKIGGRIEATPPRPKSWRLACCNGLETHLERHLNLSCTANRIMYDA
jgi:hypothetical protein